MISPGPPHRVRETLETPRRHNHKQGALLKTNDIGNRDMRREQQAFMERFRNHRAYQIRGHPPLLGQRLRRRPIHPHEPNAYVAMLIQNGPQRLSQIECPLVVFQPANIYPDSSCSCPWISWDRRCQSHIDFSSTPQWTKEKSTRWPYTSERLKLTGSHGQRPWFNAHN